MSRNRDKQDAAKAVILEHLRYLYHKQLQGEKLTDQEKHSVKFQENLVDYVFKQDRTKITETDRTSSSKKMNPKNSPYEMSRPTVRKLIKEMMVLGEIEKKDGLLQYVPTPDELSSTHPILKIAKSIPVVPLKATDLSFYRVPEQYADIIAQYVNSKFFNDDIYAVPIKDIVMCMDLQIPGRSNSVVKRKDLDSRIRRELKYFNIQETKEFDDSHGYSAEQLMDRQINQLVKDHARSELEAETYGGKSHITRNIKKKQAK